MKRGDVVVADLPYSDWSGSKQRPTVVVSTDLNNASLDDVILAAISRYTRAITHLFLDPAIPDGKQAGVLHPCYIQCENLFTLDKGRVIFPVGVLSANLLKKLDDLLRVALDL